MQVFKRNILKINISQSYSDSKLSATPRPCESPSLSSTTSQNWLKLTGNSCPICSGRKKGCQQSPDLLTITCRNISAKPTGWIFNSVNSIGSGVWKKEGSGQKKHHSTEEKAQWARTKERERKETERLERLRVKALLSPQQRHREITKLIEQLPILSLAHREALKAKGLSERQIEKGNFRSLPTQWQKLSQPINDRLPGTRKGGKGLNNPTPGILCPVPGADRRYLSLRQYNPHNEDLDIGKYVYLSSSGRGLKINDENGELPIALRFPDYLSRLARIGISEGLEIKSLLASERLGIPVIATGGHNLAGSPIALSKAIAQAQTVVGKSAIITIYGDAGAVLNPQVRNDYLKAARIIESWGLRVEFAWWNQVEKSAGDIDEIDLRATSIAYISPAEFEEIIAVHNLFEPDKEDSPEIEPDPEEYAQYLAQEEEIERLEESLGKSEFKDWLFSSSRGIGRSFRKGFSRFRNQKANISLPERIKYRPNCPLPSPIDYEGKQPPKISFKKGGRHKVIAELRSLGWDKILDRSFMGLGKSHDLGNYSNAEGKTWYLDLNHRNPSVSTVENSFSDLPVRHGGLTDDLLRTTPAGKAHQHWTKVGETPDTPALCENSHLFTKLQKKGYTHEDFAGHADGEKSTLNPICKACRFSGLCATSKGNGYGFRFARKQALEQQQIRASINSLSSPNEYSYRQDVAIVEEASQILEGSKSVTANLGDIALELLKFEQYPLMYQILHSAITPLLPYLQLGGEKLPRYGLTAAEVFETMGEPSEDMAEAIEVLKAEGVDFSNLVEQPEKYSGWGEGWKNSQAIANAYSRNEAREITAERIEQLPNKFLIDLLKVQAGLIPGTVRITPNRKLVISTRNLRHSEILKEMKAVILLDATGNKNVLARKLNLDPNSIVEIEQEMQPLKNLTVVNVNVEGMSSNQFSASCEQRIQAVLATLAEKHEEVAVLGTKKYSEALELAGHWFVDNRGTNTFSGKNTIAAFGKPMINIGAAQDEYICLYGSLAGFEEYYQDLIDAEVTQLIGRPRAHLFPEQNFFIYLIGTNHNTDHLEKLGVNVAHCEGFELTPEAGTRKQISKRKMLKAIAHLAQNKSKITMASISEFCGLSTCYIKKLVQGLDGMVALKKWVLSLIDSYRDSTQNFDLDFLLDQSKIQRWLGMNPVEAAGEMLQIIEGNGWQEFQLYLSNFGMSTQAKMWAILLPLILSEPEIAELEAEIFPPPE